MHAVVKFMILLLVEGGLSASDDEVSCAPPVDPAVVVVVVAAAPGTRLGPFKDDELNAATDDEQQLSAWSDKVVLPPTAPLEPFALLACGTTGGLLAVDKICC